MFDLIIVYFVIMFLINTAKSVKEQQKKEAENPKKAASGKQIGKYAPYGNKRYPAKKQSVPTVERSVSQQTKKAAPAVVSMEERREKSYSQPMAMPGNSQVKPARQPAVAAMAAVPGEEERLQEILAPTEENILTGLVWSEILGPPVCKRSRRY